MEKRTKSILSELDNLFISKDKKHFVESKANNLIQGAINLLTFIKENFEKEQADELERRFINSIRAHDSSKFIRGIRKVNPKGSINESE